MVFKTSSKIFLTYLQKPVCNTNADIFCISVNICKTFSLLFLRWKAKEKQSLIFWITFVT